MHSPGLHRFRRVVFFAILVACVGNATQTDVPPQTSQAPSNPSELKNLTLEQLSQVEVTTPSKGPERAFRIPVAVYVITGEEIRRSGATTIPEALRLAPGVEVARIDSNKWSIGIRGFGSRFSRSVLVMIDGRTVYTELLAGTYWEVQNVMMQDIDRIEVIRGPGGTIWGPNAVNGVINIITKDSRDTQGEFASGGGGNEEQGFLNFRYGGKSKGDQLTYRIYGMAFTRGPEYHLDNQNFDDWRAAQGGFRIDWRVGERDTVTIQGDLYSEEAGERVSATSYTPPYSVDVDANADLSGGNVVARWQRKVREGNDIQVEAYYDRTNRYEPNLAEIRDTFDVDFIHRIRAPWRQQISWGFGARASIGNELPVVSGLQFIPAKRTDYLLTGFIQDEIALVEDRLSLTLGTKLLRTNFTGAEPQPSVRLVWEPTSKQSVWAGFTHAVRTPSDADREFALLGYITTTPSGVPFFARFNPNPQFAPEQLNGYELGYRRLITRSLFVDVASFYNHYHNLFSEDITGPAFFEPVPEPAHLLLPAQFRNDLMGYTKGVEVAPEWRPTNFWRLRGSYSFLHMNLTKASGTPEIGTAPIIEGSSPRHQVSIESSLDISKSFQLDLTYRHVSALPGLTPPVPAYSTGDARFSWRLARQLELFIVGRNLFQPYHFEYAGDPGPLIGIRRSGYLGMTWTK